jgi:uncharacterized DUF497 family protein
VDSRLEFEWDPAKADANFRKHGITFEQAIGLVDSAVLVVVYIERRDNLIRIISARLATPRERRRYANG